MSSKCTQHVITGFQAPSPPVRTKFCSKVFLTDGSRFEFGGDGISWEIHFGSEVVDHSKIGWDADKLDEGRSEGLEAYDKVFPKGFVGLF